MYYSLCRRCHFQTLQPKHILESCGVGLNIVKIVDLEGGKITLDSAKDKGSLFHFTWPKTKDTNKKYEGVAHLHIKLTQDTNQIK